jgi:diguanylate cyclase (GGDEF)-like protein
MNDAQRLRLRRFAMSAALYGIWITLAVAARAAGMIDLPTDVTIAMTVGALATLSGFYLIIRSGHNLRLRDPSMTFLQCVVGLTWLVVFMYQLPAWRDLLMSVYVTGLLFGIFHLNRAEFFTLAFIAFAGYLAMIGIEFALRPDTISIGEQLLRVAVIGSVLIWCSFFGAHVSRLRERLSQRNRHLEVVVDEVTRLAERDHLTKAYNRRSIIDRLVALRDGAMRYGETFSVAIIDLDYFKRVNDEYGHLAGDTVLADFASRVKSELRLLDEISPVVDPRALGRFGGEEFILILPRTDIDGALECTERVRLTTMQHPFGKLHITISAGVAELAKGESIDSLLRRADKALYAAKAAGRNRICEAAATTDASPGAHEVVRLSDYKSQD